VKKGPRNAIQQTWVQGSQHCKRGVSQQHFRIFPYRFSPKAHYRNHPLEPELAKKIVERNFIFALPETLFVLCRAFDLGL
jgi:hypothetical protein